MNVSRFIKAGQLFATVAVSRFEELLRLAARVPREAAGEAAVQIGDASVHDGRLIVDVTGSSLRAVGRGVSEAGRAVTSDDGG